MITCATTPQPACRTAAPPARRPMRAARATCPATPLPTAAGRPGQSREARRRAKRRMSTHQKGTPSD
ncbi:hypothetical protein DR62_08070 [Burkholderia thailandensis]|nr:hypothetical protein DR62_08070 [Burkholderia thailandensis]